MLRLARSELHIYRLPYLRTVTWANAIEAEGVYALLVLTADDGSIGVAEGTVKASWSGASPASLRAALDDLLLPPLAGIDLADAAAVARAIAPIPENRLAKTLIDNACWTLRAHSAGVPLWQRWGGTPAVDVTWTVTRDQPAAMARDAAAMVERHGFRSLKVKGGQGLDTDRRALTEIVAAVGPQVALYVDANSAYAADQAAAYVDWLADAGAMLAEDPCRLAPDAMFTRLQGAARLPLLVDSACTTAADAQRFLDCGARALSTKPGRVGFSECRQIGELAAAHGAAVAIGLYAESALGTLVNLQLAAATPPAQRIAAAEQTFFLLLQSQVLQQALPLAAGCITLPQSADLHSAIDFERVQAHRIG